MKRVISLVGGSAAALLLTTTAVAQAPTAAPRFKAPRAATPVETPRQVQTRIDGGAAARLRRADGPRPASSARLATLPALTAAPAASRVQRLERGAESGLPVFLEVAPISPVQRTAVLPPADASLAFLDELADVLAIRQPRQEFRVADLPAPDELGQRHVRLTQTWQGLPVYGAEVVVHLGADGRPARLTGRYFRSPVGVGTRATVAASAAAQRAEAGLRTRTRVRLLTPAEDALLQYAGPTTELVVYHDQLTARPQLAWHVTTRPNVLEQWESFVDAGSGQLIRQYESSCTATGPRTATATDLNGAAQTINTYEINGTYFMLDAARSMFNAAASNMPDEPVGGILTISAHGTSPSNFNVAHVTSTTNGWADPSSVSAHVNGGAAFSYYKTTHNRNSIDGQGGTILSVIHVADDNGAGLDNAYWNGRFISYGDGATEFRPLAGGLDVAAHEMTHGVVSKTANLEYRDQSGALNEHMADVFGAMVDRNDWQIGEDVVRPGVFAGGALRSLQDPHNAGSSLADNGYQPRTMSEFYGGSQDNGGVHINSGIPNWAFYKFATAISKDHAEKIWYRALTQYLTRSSQFIDLRIGTIQAARDLYGNTAPDIAALGAAFDQVGIGSGTSTPPPTSLPTNPGADFLLTYDTDPGVAGTFYLSSTTGTNFQQKSGTEAVTRPSVTDDGEVAVFVDAQHQIRALSLTGTPNEVVLSSQGIWHSVATSKDGNKLAAVTMAADTAIYVFNLVTGQAARFQLYIPTTNGVPATGVRYADALEWDYTGQYVIYDANNVVQNQGQDYEFWNINFLKAWDNGANTWGDGSIETLIGNLPDGISIGNPVLSKNSPNVMAFDMLDANGGATPFSVLALNLETNDGATVFGGTAIPGTPNYSKLDNKLVFTALSNTGDTVAAVISMQADKIHPTGNAALVVSAAKWPVWLAQGTRVLPTAVAEDAAALPGLATYPNPVTDVLTVDSEVAGTATLYNVLGQVVLTAPLVPGTHQQLRLDQLPAGTYLLRATDGHRTATRRVVKL